MGTIGHIGFDIEMIAKGQLRNYFNTATARLALAEPQKFVDSLGGSAQSAVLAHIANAKVFQDVNYVDNVIGHWESLGLQFPTLRETLRAIDGLCARLRNVPTVSHDGLDLGSCEKCMTGVIMRWSSGLAMHCFCSTCSTGEGLAWIKSAEQFLMIFDFFEKGDGKLSPCQAMELVRFVRNARVRPAILQFLEIYGFDRADDLLHMIDERLLTEGAMVSLVQDPNLLRAHYCEFERLLAVVHVWSNTPSQGHPLHATMRKYQREGFVSLPPAPLPKLEWVATRTFGEVVGQIQEAEGVKGAAEVEQGVVEVEQDFVSPRVPLGDLVNFETPLFARAVELVLTHLVLSEQGGWANGALDGSWLDHTRVWGKAISLFTDTGKGKRKAYMGRALRYLCTQGVLETNAGGLYRYRREGERSEDGAMIALWLETTAQ